MSVPAELRIETARLLITVLDEGMAAAIQRQSQDEATRRFLPDEVFDTFAEAQETVRELIGAYQSPDGPWVYAVLRRNGAFVGYVQLCRIDDGWEIGYHIGKEHRGQGYAPESVRAFLPVIMARLAIDRVWGVVDERNVASCRVLKKCDFKLVGQDAMKRYLYQA